MIHHKIDELSNCAVKFNFEQISFFKQGGCLSNQKC